MGRSFNLYVPSGYAQCTATLEYQDPRLEAAFDKDLCDNTGCGGGVLVALTAFLLRQARIFSSFAEGPEPLLVPQTLCALLLAYTFLVHSLHRRPATLYWARLALRLWLLLLAPGAAAGGDCSYSWGAFATSCYTLLVLQLLCPLPYKWNLPALLVQASAWAPGRPASWPSCMPRAAQPETIRLPAQLHVSAGTAQLAPSNTAPPRPPRPAAAAARDPEARRLAAAAGRQPGDVHPGRAGLARLRGPPAPQLP